MVKKSQFLFFICLVLTLGSISNVSWAAAEVEEERISFLIEAHPWLLDLAEVYPGTTKGAVDLPSARIIQAYKDVKFKKRSAAGWDRSADLHVLSAWAQETVAAYAEKLRSEPHMGSEKAQALLDGADAEAELYRGMGPFTTPNIANWGLLFRIAAIGSRDGEESDSGVLELLRPFLSFAYAGSVRPEGEAVPSEEVSVSAMLEEGIAEEQDSVDEYDSWQYRILPKAARNNIKENLNSIAPIPVPFLGGKTGLTTITLMILNDVHNISLPTTAIPAHGVRMSPRDFMVHDYAHHTISSSREKTKAWASRLTKEFIEKDGLDFIQATNIAARVAVLRYNQVRKTAVTLIRNAAATYTSVVRSDTTSMEEKIRAKYTYNARIVALFTASHEEEDINEEVLDATSQTEAARIWLQQVVSSNTLPDSYDLDPFNTHPVTGAIASTSSAERDRIIDAIEIEKVQGSGDEVARTFGDVRGDLFEDPGVSETPLIIRIKGLLRDGKEVKASAQTMRLTYGDAEDQNVLLRLAGRGVAVPDFTDDNHETARGKAFDFIRTVRAGMRALGEEVRDVAVAELDEMNLVPDTAIDATRRVLRDQERAIVAEVGLSPTHNNLVRLRLGHREGPLEEAAV